MVPHDTQKAHAARLRTRYTTTDGRLLPELAAIFTDAAGRANVTAVSWMPAVEHPGGRTIGVEHQGPVPPYHVGDPPAPDGGVRGVRLRLRAPGLRRVRACGLLGIGARTRHR